jgi:hypothetical protein
MSEWSWGDCRPHRLLMDSRLGSPLVCGGEMGALRGVQAAAGIAPDTARPGWSKRGDAAQRRPLAQETAWALRPTGIALSRDGTNTAATHQCLLLHPGDQIRSAEAQIKCQGSVHLTVWWPLYTPRRRMRSPVCSSRLLQLAMMTAPTLTATVLTFSLSTVARGRKAR